MNETFEYLWKKLSRACLLLIIRLINVYYNDVLKMKASGEKNESQNNKVYMYRTKSSISSKSLLPYKKSDTVFQCAQYKVYCFSVRVCKKPYENHM